MLYLRRFLASLPRSFPGRKAAPGGAKHDMSSGPQRPFSSNSAPAENPPVPPVVYPFPVKFFHWVVGIPVLAAVGTVLAAQQCTKESPKFLNAGKGEWMWRHKSMGLLVGLLMPLRLGMRLASRAAGKLPGHVPGTPPVLSWAGDITHWALYGFLLVMPVSGRRWRRKSVVSEKISSSCRRTRTGTKISSSCGDKILGEFIKHNVHDLL